MIYQLVRRDLGWQRIWFVTLVVAIGLGSIPFGIQSALPHSRVPERIFLAILSSLMLLEALSIVVLAGANRRVTLFQAALPIAARDLFLARLFSLLAVVWVPVLGTAAALCMTAGGSFFRFASLLVAAAVASVAVVALQSLRLSQFSAPPAWAGWFLPVPLLPALLVYFVPTAISLAVCAALFVALLWWDLARLPRSFQIAPRDAAAASPARRGARFLRPVWWPLFRSAYTPAASVPLFNSGLILVAMGWWSVAPLMLAAFVTQSLIALQWARPLPLSRHRLFALLLLPPLLLEAAFQATRPLGVSSAAAMVALTLLSISVSLAMNEWKLLSTGAKILALPAFVIIVLLAPIGALVVDMARSPHARGPRYSTRLLAEQMDKLLPGHPLILALASLPLLAALYWVAQRQFVNVDSIPVTQTNVHAAEFSTALSA
jgi:hypothetical protein